MHAANKLRGISGTDAILGALGSEPEQVASPWRATEEQSAVWLQERGFRPRKQVEPTWTDEEVATLKQAFKEVASGDRLKPSESMTTAHFLSHHVMEGRHSQQSCCRKLYQIRRELGAAEQMASAVLDELRGDESSEDDAADSEDSEDEVDVPRSLAMQLQL